MVGFRRSSRLHGRDDRNGVIEGLRCEDQPGVMADLVARPGATG